MFSILVVAFVSLTVVSGFSSPSLALRSRSGLSTLRMRSYAPSAGYIASRGAGAKSSDDAMTINLTKNMVGAGVFSLSAKVAQISTSTSIMQPVGAMVLGLAAWATYNFYTLSEVCRISNSSTYPEAWSRTIGSGTKWLVSMVIVLAPIIACLSNTIVLTDVFGTLLKAAKVPAAISSSRNMVIALLSAFIFYPLCVKKDLGNLKKASTFGLLGHLTALGVMLKRANDGSYAVGGQYYAGSAMETATKAAAKVVKVSKGKGAAAAAAASAGSTTAAYFVVASMVSYCIVSHYNAPKYYNELEKKRSLPAVIAKAHLATALIYIGSMFAGLKLFGKSSKSFALGSLAATDPLSLVANLAFGCSVLASQPLIFLVMRNWFVESLPKVLPFLKSQCSNEKVTIGLLAMIGCICSRVQDVATVGTVAGSLLGSAMMFVFPPLLYIKALEKEATKEQTKAPTLKVLFNTILLVGGVAFWGSASNRAIRGFIAT